MNLAHRLLAFLRGPAPQPSHLHLPHGVTLRVDPKASAHLFDPLTATGAVIWPATHVIADFLQRRRAALASPAASASTSASASATSTSTPPSTCSSSTPRLLRGLRVLELVSYYCILRIATPAAAAVAAAAALAAGSWFHTC